MTDITSHHITSHHITSHHITSHHITPNHAEYSTGIQRESGYAAPSPARHMAEHGWSAYDTGDRDASLDGTHWDPAHYEVPQHMAPAPPARTHVASTWQATGDSSTDDWTATRTALQSTSDNVYDSANHHVYYGDPSPQQSRVYDEPVSNTGTYEYDMPVSSGKQPSVPVEHDYYGTGVLLGAVPADEYENKMLTSPDNDYAEAVDPGQSSPLTLAVDDAYIDVRHMPLPIISNSNTTAAQGHLDDDDDTFYTTGLLLSGGHTDGVPVDADSQGYEYAPPLHVHGAAENVYDEPNTRAQSEADVDL